MIATLKLASRVGAHFAMSTSKGRKDAGLVTHKQPENLQLRVSRLVEECLLTQGWLLDHEEVLERSLAWLRVQRAKGCEGEQQLEASIQRIAYSMVQGALAKKKVLPGQDAFLRELARGFGLTSEELIGARQRFHSLAVEDRRAFLLLMRTEAKLSSKLVPGARRALLALFGIESLHAKSEFDSASNISGF